MGTLLALFIPLFCVGFGVGMLVGFMMANNDVSKCLLKRNLITYLYCGKTNRVRPFWVSDGTEVDIL